MLVILYYVYNEQNMTLLNILNFSFCHTFDNDNALYKTNIIHS